MQWTIGAVLYDFAEHVTFRADADVTHYRELVQIKYDSLIDVPEVRKNNGTASGLRQEGNRLYVAKDYDEALLKYNESICNAETGSEELGMGYANRSAIYFETERYEFALYNIALAKKNHYPERLMPKLLSRERICKEKIDKSTRTVHGARTQIVRDANPRIPFLAKGICLKEVPDFGRGLVAEQDFRVGEVVLDEKPLLTNLVPSFSSCSFCYKDFQHSLIPCPNCVFNMYCSEECLEKDAKFTHRFECGVAKKLTSLSLDIIYFAAKFFFYGLTLFNDNVDEMKKFCQKPFDTEANPLLLNYTNYDPMEEFRTLHNGKPECRPAAEAENRLTAAIVYTVYMKNPLVRSIFSSNAKKDFMLRSFLKYSKTTSEQAVSARQQKLGVLCPIASFVNHSCDPNAIILIHSSQVKLTLIRPVAKNEHICITYGPTWWKSDPTFMFHFTCVCAVCKLNEKGEWWSKVTDKLPPRAYKDISLFGDILVSDNINSAAKMNAIKQYIQRYAYVHPEPFFARALQMYQMLLYKITGEEIRMVERAEIAARVEKL